MGLHIALLLLGVYACSTAVIFIRACTVDPILLAALRLFVAAIALTPLFLRDRMRYRTEYRTEHLRATLLPGVVLSLHFVTWIIGARMTPAANASLIVNLVPVSMPFFLHFMLAEKLTPGEIAGTILAITGMAILSGADLNADPLYFRGDVMCFVSMLLFCFYLALGRKNRHFRSVWLYVVPLYYAAGIVSAILYAARLLILPAPAANPQTVSPLVTVLMVLGLGIIPTVFGHSILNYAMRHLRGQVVSIVNMGQFIFAGIMAYAILHEVPGAPFYAASGLVVAGGVLAVRSAAAAAGKEARTS